MNKNFLVGFVRLFIILFVFSVSGVVFALEEPPLLVKKDPKTIISDLETLIPELMKKARVPGLQIALVREGKIIWNKGFGVKNAKTKEPVTRETIFEAASLTKPFFAYAVMKLVEEKVLDLDTPLLTYLPKEEIEKEIGHSLEEPGFHKEWLEKITARHVLSHSSGLPHGEREKPFPIFFAPGSKYKYSAVGYYFLQLVVERLKGEKLETIMKKVALDPLGMKNSCMIWQEAYEKTSANGHGYFGKPEDFRKRSRAHAAATLYTTAADYARFVCAVLEGEGIKKETLKTMFTPQIDVDKEKGLTWTLGFGLQEDENGPAFWQWGDYGIFRNYIIAYPRHKMAVVYLTNSYYGLSICADLVSRSIGGQALGNAFLDYKHYDYPVYEFAWKVQEHGPQAVKQLLPKMKAKYPDDFSKKTLDRMGSIFINEKLFDEAIALYDLHVKENPESVHAISHLARAYLEKGDRDQAKLYYHKALKVKKDEKFDTKSIDWAMAYIQALEKPKNLSGDYLKTLAGDYETRHVQLRNGSLYYFREGAANKDYVKLFAMSKDTFIIEGLIFFRLKFELDPQGQATAIVGMHEDGNQDRTKRDK
ncbi:MAG: serine hydrolase [Candidatus Aminicenantes bacterium]|nr:MAG: serine hydrolase [Candidatus Aminicenantes bacterium]